MSNTIHSEKCSQLEQEVHELLDPGASPRALLRVIYLTQSLMRFSLRSLIWSLLRVLATLRSSFPNILGGRAIYIVRFRLLETACGVGAPRGPTI